MGLAVLDVLGVAVRRVWPSCGITGGWLCTGDARAREGMRRCGEDPASCWWVQRTLSRQ